MSAVLHFLLAGHAGEMPSSVPIPPAAGAAVTFDGHVRDTNDGRPVRGLLYQVYPELAAGVGESILREEAVRHDVVSITAAHRFGTLAVGDLAVRVIVTAVHRDAAFAAARAVIERLKFGLPVWKKELYTDGEGTWIAADGGKA